MQFNQFRYVVPALKLMWQAARGWMITWTGLLLIQSILPVLSVYFTREVFNRGAMLVQQGWDSPALQPLLVILALLVITQVAQEVLGTLTDWVRTAQGEAVRDYISNLIHRKSTSLDLSFFETPEYYDLLHRVRTEARQRPLTLLENLGSLVTSTLSLMGMMAILLLYSPWLPFVLFISTLPALWVVLRYSRRYNRWRLENTMKERRTAYFDFILTERPSAAEVRLFKLGSHYRQTYQFIRKELRTGRLNITKDKMVTNFIATLLALSVAGGAMVWMGWRVINGAAALGDLAAFYQIFQQGQKLMQVLMQNAGNIYQSVLFLEDLFDFLELEPRIATTDEVSEQRAPLRESIRFENVSFRYPGSERFALKNFSLSIPAGKIIALVGENGMGKTTLMKLLCRFYDPVEGRILWDNKDLRELPLQTLQCEISMLFQEPYHYPETARHNIAVGDLSADPTMSDIETAAQVAAADNVIQRLPQGYETVLGKWFGGEELSVGQWQRVSLARAFLRQGSLIILDEPTSAMDAWAEMDWLSRVRQAAEGRTLIMITHRFTTAMQADYIYVIHEHKIIEEGTHESLLAQGKRYAQSWHEQMRTDMKDNDAEVNRA